MARADELLDAGDRQSALIELKSLAQDYPDSLDTRARLASLHLDIGDATSALKEAERAEKLGMGSGQFDYLMIRALVARGKHEQAIERIQALADWDKSAELLVLFADASLLSGDGAKARLYFDDALQLDDANPDALLGLARLEALAGNVETAMDFIDRSLSLKPENYRAYLLRGEIEAFTGDWQAAIEAYQRAYALNDFIPDGILGEVRAYLELKQFPEAQKQLAVAAGRFGNDVRVTYYQALSSMMEGRSEDAIDLFREVLTAAPDNALSQYYLALLLQKKGELERAVDLLLSYLRLRPNDINGKKLLGSIYLSLADPAAALNLFKDLSPAEEGDGQVAAMRASALEAMGKPDAAIAEFERAAGLLPDDKLVATNLLLARARSGKVEEVLAEMRELALGDGDTQEARLWITSIYSGQQEWDKVIDFVNSLPDSSREDPLMYNALGTAYSGKKAWAEAREAFETALEKLPESNLIELNLATLELAQDDVEGAKARVDRLMERGPLDARTLVLAARVAYAGGDVDRYIALLEKARAIDRNDFASRSVLCQVRLERGELNEALETAYEALKLQPGDVPVMLVVADALNRQGRLDDADVVANQAAATAPGAYLPAYFAAMIKIRQGRYADAEPYLAQARRAQPESLELAFAEAFNALRLGLEDAGSRIERLQAMEGESARVRELKGDLALAQNEPEKAAGFFLDSYEESGAAATVLKFNYALERAGQLERASEGLREAVERHPGDEQILLALGGVLERRGRPDEALGVYEQVLALNRASVPALNNAALLLSAVGDKRAVELIAQAHELAPDNANVNDSYGRILAASGRVDESLKFFERAQAARKTLDRTDALSLDYHHAITRARAGQTPAAVAQLKALLDSGEAFPEREDAAEKYRKLARVNP